MWNEVFKPFHSASGADTRSWQMRCSVRRQRRHRKGQGRWEARLMRVAETTLLQVKALDNNTLRFRTSYYFGGHPEVTYLASPTSPTENEIVGRCRDKFPFTDRELQAECCRSFGKRSCLIQINGLCILYRRALQSPRTVQLPMTSESLLAQPYTAIYTYAVWRI